MPITGPSSYPQVMQQFIAHWNLVNDFLDNAGEDPLTLAAAYALVNFQTARTQIVTAINDVTAAEAAQQLAIDTRDLKKTPIRARLTQFRAAVKAYLPGSRYINALPTLPGLSNIETRYVKPFQDAAQLWAAINNDHSVTGFTPPLLLAGGYPLATFNTDLTALRAAYDGVTNLAYNTRSVRGTRDTFLNAAYSRMLEYRQAVVARLPADNPLIQSIPAVTAPAGSTPLPVNLSGAWNTSDAKAKLTWTASPASTLDHYSVRYCSGAHYRVKEETVIATLPSTTLTYETLTGLAAPGAVSSFKVYVVLTTGNEKGSAPVVVTRPASAQELSAAA